MNVEIIGTEAAQFPEKEYINGIFVAVWEYSLHVGAFFIIIMFILSLFYFLSTSAGKVFCVLKFLSDLHGIKDRNVKNKTY